MSQDKQKSPEELRKKAFELIKKMQEEGTLVKKTTGAYLRKRFKKRK